MSTLLAPNFDQQFFDNNGEPLVGGFVYTYAAGTTTPLAAYTDSTGVTAQTNPIVLDGYGRAPIWLSGAAYKFVLKDSTGVTILTVDNVATLTPGFITSSMIAAGAVGTTQLANGAVTTPILAANAVTAANIANNTITNAQIANNTIGANQIANGAITTTQISSTAGILATQLANPSGLSFGAQTTTFFTFTVFPANATAGAVYSNNGQQFTVLTTISSGSALVCQATGMPAGSSTTLTIVSGTGDATISVSSTTAAGSYSWTAPSGIIRIIIEACGGGGGGWGAANVSSGGPGIDTFFNGVRVGYGVFTSTTTSYGSPNMIYPGGAPSTAGTSSPGYVGGITTGTGGGGGSSDYGSGGAGATQGNPPAFGSWGAGGGGNSGSQGGSGSKKQYTIMNIVGGTTYSISIGAGGPGTGLGGGAPGASGTVIIYS